MSDALTIEQPGPPASEVVRVPATANGKEIRGKLKVSLDNMVWRGLAWKQAAEEAGFTPDALRKALERPHVQRYVREQKQVFRAAASGQNIQRAVEIRDQRDNHTAAIQAIRYLDGQSDEQSRNVDGRQVTPGVVITVNVQRDSGPADETVIEVGAGATDTQSGGYDPAKR